MFLKEFDDFMLYYDMELEKISLKYYHTQRVAILCEKIAASLYLTDEERYIAWVIGMLHDIGRFDQATMYDTFNDKESFDHAEYGVRLLFDEGMIENFKIDKKWFNVINKAIKYHSVISVPDNLTEYEKMFCRIIRDADMLDIMMIYKRLSWYNDEMTKQPISPEVVNKILNKKTVPHKIKKNIADSFIGTVAFINEIYYPESKKILIESNILNEFLEIEMTSNKSLKNWKKIKEYIKEYIEKGSK